MIAIRLDAEDPSKLLEVLEKDGGAHLVVKEMAEENPHYHAILHSTKKHTAVRQALKRAMPNLNGNGSYSCVPVRDLEKYERYMMKGDSEEKMPDVVKAYGLEYANDEWQKDKHDSYWEENRRIGRKRKMESVDDVVLQICTEENISWSNREKLAEVYIRELSSRDKPINLFSLRAKLNLLQIKLCPDDSALKDLAAHCVNY